MMSWSLFLAPCLSALLSSGSGPAAALPSDPVAVYALIDRAQRDEKSATLVLEGAFLIGKGKIGGESHPASRGTMHLRASAEAAEAHAQLFTELVAAAGSGKVIAFGTRRDGAGYRVGSSAAPQWVQLQGRVAAFEMPHAAYEPVVCLRSFPRTFATSMAEETNYSGAREVILRAEAGLHRSDSLRYCFEIEFENGERFASPLLRVADSGALEWRRSFTLESEETLHVSVRAFDEALSLSGAWTLEVRAPKT